MTIEKSNYKHQAKRISAMYANKDYKEVLRSSYELYRGGVYADQSSAVRYTNIEEMFMLDPFTYQRLRKDFEPALAATSDMLVLEKRPVSDIDYSVIPMKDIEEKILKFIEDVVHLNIFDKELGRYLKRAGVFAKYFDEDGKSKINPRGRTVVGEDITIDSFIEVSNYFRRLDSLELFYSFDLNTLFRTDGRLRI